ncbi:MAG TPA: hypothetical protein EYQ06_08790 [Flavobacteriales bacterium]|jgi:N-acetylneuraminate synthase/N,N'-diacetyllegionaminate synthase|nr:hypothetical protein [Flavobacteriales bacterium]
MNLMTEIIAEIGQNFNGDIDVAIQLILEAKKSGADVAKFQLYNAKELFSREGNPWYEYNCSTELTYNNVKKLKQVCDDNDIEFMASAFDVERVDWLEDVGVQRHKLASRSIFDQDLINKVLKTNKPTFISLGMWNQEGFPEINNENAKYLYCVSKYPTELEDVKLKQVDFDKYFGFSDHTVGITASCVALSRGARIIEKHFTLDREAFGPDHICSMTPNQLLQLSTFRDELKLCL